MFQSVAQKILEDLSDLLLIMAKRRCRILSAKFDKNPLGLERPLKLVTVLDTKELFSLIGRDHLQHVQNRFPEDLLDQERFLLKQSFLGAGNLYHLLKEGLSFLNLP